MTDTITQQLLDAAESQDRKLDDARIAQLKESYAFFKKAGLDETGIKKTMNLTGHEMRLICKS